MDSVGVSSLSRMVTVAWRWPPGFAVTPVGSEAVSMAIVKVSSPSVRSSSIMGMETVPVVPPANTVSVRAAALSKSTPRVAVPEVTVTGMSMSVRAVSDRRATGCTVRSSFTLNPDWVNSTVRLWDTSLSSIVNCPLPRRVATRAPPPAVAPLPTLTVTVSSVVSVSSLARSSTTKVAALLVGPVTLTTPVVASTDAEAKS